MPKIPSVLELLQAGVHFGHKASRWHPKMKPYIFGSRNGIHIIDLDKTQAKLAAALDYVRDLAARGGVVLFLGTKRQAKDVIKSAAEDCGMPYVSGRWLGGTLTNFGEIMNVIRRYNDLKAKQASGALAKYTKKEQAQFAKDIEDMEAKVGGIQSITRAPDAIYIVDLKKEKTALAEAMDRKVPVVALTDTNTNPEDVAYAIPSNDDAVKTIELMTKLVAEAVKEGKALREQKAAADAKAQVKAVVM
jgi:small subunit ribosomal protein S2